MWKESNTTLVGRTNDAGNARSAVPRRRRNRERAERMQVFSIPTPPVMQAPSRSEENNNNVRTEANDSFHDLRMGAMPGEDMQARGQVGHTQHLAVRSLLWSAGSASSPICTETRAAGGSVRQRNLFCAARRPYHDPPAHHDLGRMDIDPLIGSRRGWLTLQRGRRNSACSPDTAAKAFRENIWKYNRAFSFTSLGVKEDHSVNNGPGKPVFRISVELCHWSGALVPEHGQLPRYAQLYMYEPRAALEAQMQQNSDLDRRTVEGLQDMLSHHHQYVPVYRHAFEILRTCDPVLDVSIRLRVAPGNDRRRYNLPTADEVAIILLNDASTETRDIILHQRQGRLHRISELHPA
ncbi:hypothetical protein Hypma_009973 [Hypsizygus marmoreus]|uniref:Helitron helicase-like domain-containing protein n=1 Tax=Hypsizygus marmoreus TaxID=39966 RepID=A0A369JND8_HYPMA|nr:hypothetical protein Hypma_009973 [Hypsizygus marmoreus]